MGLPRFIKLPGHKQFSYSPRYWDPEKEARNERIKDIKKEMGIEVPSGPNRSTIKRGSIRQVRRTGKVKSNRASNIRLLVILAILFLLAYLIFYR